MSRDLTFDSLSRLRMSKKRSPIWDYFKVGEDTKFGICNACGQSISHGGKTTKTFNTTNLVYHIRGMHAELHSELLKKCDERTKEKISAPSSSRQLTLQDKARKWDINDPHFLFSGAGDVYDDKRNRLAPEKAEMLLFIKNNFSLQ